MSGELFRQDGKSKGERAVVQGEDGSKLSRKPVDGASVGEQAEKQRHEGPVIDVDSYNCLLYTSPSPRDATLSRMPSSA